MAEEKNRGFVIPGIINFVPQKAAESKNAKVDDKITAAWAGSATNTGIYCQRLVRLAEKTSSTAFYFVILIVGRFRERSLHYTHIVHEQRDGREMEAQQFGAMDRDRLIHHARSQFDDVSTLGTN